MPKLGEAFVVIRAALGPLRAGLAAAKSAVTKAMTTISNAIKKIMATTYKYIKRGALAIAAGIGYAIYAFGGFEKAMKEATAAMGVTDTEFKNLSNLVREQSKELNIDSIQAAGGIKQLGYAGLSAADAMKVFVPLLKLAKAGMADMTMVTKSTLDIMGAYQIGFDKTKQITDLLLKTWTKSRMELDEMAEALSFTGATAATSKLSLEELLTVLWALAEAGIRGTRAGTTIRRMLLNLKAPMSDVSKSLEDLGIKVYDSTGKLRPFMKIFEEMGDALSGVTEKQRNMAMKVIFGHRAVEGATIAWRKTTKEIRDYTKSLEDAGGTVDKVLDYQLNSLIEQFGRWRKMIKGIFIDIGKYLSPALRWLIDDFQEGTKRIAEFVKKSEIPITKWALIIAAKFNFVRKVIQDFLVGMVTNWPETWDYMKEYASASLDVIWGTFKKQGRTALDVLIEQFKAFGKSLAIIFEKIWSDIEGKFGKKKYFHDVLETEFRGLTGLSKRMTGEWPVNLLTMESLKKKYPKEFAEAERIAKEATRRAEENEAFTAMLWSDAKEKIGQAWGKAYDFAVEAAKKIKDEIAELEEKAFEGITKPKWTEDLIDKRLKELRDRLKEIAEFIANMKKEGDKAAAAAAGTAGGAGGTGGAGGAGGAGRRIGFVGLREAWNAMAMSLSPKDRTLDDILKENRLTNKKMDEQTAAVRGVNTKVT